MSLIDLVIFFGYMLGITIFGGSFYRKNKTTEAFTLGNSNIPSWVVGMSIFATFVSSISYLALPGNAFLSDWNAFVFSLSIPVASILAFKIFVPLYRKVNSPSAYTFLENKFGPWARVYVSACYLFTQLMRVGTILYLLALALNAVFGWDLAGIIIITGIAITIYSVLGGIQAVVWTDAIQGIILITGALVCIFFIFMQMPEGPEQVFSLGMAQNKFSLGSLSLDLSKSTFWVVLVYGIFINLQNYGIDQNYVQRYMAARNLKEAKQSALFGGLLYIPVSLLFLFIGSALFAFYTSGGAELPADLQDPNKSDRIFPYFIVNELPPGLTGLLIASIFAAGMSTVSTSFNSAATVFLTDFYKRFKSINPSNQQAMRVLYIASCLIAIIGILIALAMINVKSALDTWWKLASVFSGGMLGLFLLGAFTRNINKLGAQIGVITGIIVIGWLSISSAFLGPQAIGNQLHSYLTIVVGTTTIFLIGFLFSLMKKK